MVTLAHPAAPPPRSRTPTRRATPLATMPALAHPAPPPRALPGNADSPQHKKTRANGTTPGREAPPQEPVPTAVAYYLSVNVFFVATSTLFAQLARSSVAFM